MEESVAGLQPARDVTVSLDGDRNAVTDATGRYLFTNVPEGSHEVALNMDQLPTDYDPGSKNRDRVAIAPRSIARTDFTVHRLTSLTGRIVAPKDMPIESVVIRLAGTRLYTTPDADGVFNFFNLREGAYDVVLDDKSAPEGSMIGSASSIHVSASNVNPTGLIEFVIQAKPVEVKPIREILQIGNGAAKVTAPASKN
jgi:hypothetical protein